MKALSLRLFVDWPHYTHGLTNTKQGSHTEMYFGPESSTYCNLRNHMQIGETKATKENIILI